MKVIVISLFFLMSCTGQIQVSTSGSSKLSWGNISPANTENLSNYTMRGSCHEGITSFRITSPPPEQLVTCDSNGWSISLDLTNEPDGPIVIKTDLKDLNTGKYIEFETSKDTSRPSGVISSTIISPSNANEVEVDVHFSEEVKGIDESAFTVTNALITRISGVGQDFKIRLSPKSQGSFSLLVKENSVYDLAGNANTESNLLSLLHDSQAPTVALTSEATEVTSLSTFSVTATFNEQVVNFDDSKIQLTNATLSGFTQSGNAYTFNITPTAEGEVQILIPQLVTQDLAENFNEEGKLLRYYDTTSPTVNVSSTMVGSIHLPGEEIPFTWSATDNNLAGDVQLSYSIDGGSTWIAIGTYPITPSEYVWIAPDVDSSNIYFKIVTADEAGNNSSAQVGPLTIDNNFIPPSMTLTPNPDFSQLAFYGGQTVSFDYSSSGDNLVENSVQIQISFNEGVNWTTVLSGAPLSGSYTYTVPNEIDQNPVYFRLQNENLREEIGSVLSPYFIIDNNPPQLTSIQINDGGGYAITPFLSVTVGVTDIHEIYISLTEIPLADSCADYEDLSGVPLNPNWRKWDNDVAGMSLSFQVTPDDGGKKICAWAKDGHGRMAAAPLASTVVLESRYIPILSQFEVYQNTPGKFTAAAGETITINYTATDNEGLSKAPLSFAYTLNGSTWLDVETHLDIQNPENVTWMHSNESLALSVSGTYTLPSPSSEYFRVQGRAKDRAGNISIVALSNTFNSGNWQIFLGSNDRGEGGVGKGVAITDSWSSAFFAIHPHTGDFYFIEREWGLRKLDIRTGLISSIVKLFDPAFSATLSESQLLKGSEVVDFANAVNKVTSSNVTEIVFDSKGKLYMSNIIYTTTETAKGIVYQVDLDAKIIRPYAGGGSSITSENPFERVILGGTIAFDEKDNLYLWDTCISPVTTRSAAKRVIRISQNADSSPGNISVVFGGGCLYENPISGETAVSSKSGVMPYSELSSIVPINENSFYLMAYGGFTPIKVINGTVRSVNVAGIGGNGNTNRLIYNKYDGYLYANLTNEGLGRFKPSLLGDGGETALETYLPDTYSDGCQEDGVPRTSACTRVAKALRIDSEGTLFFTDGPGINKPTNTRIRYVNRSGVIDTLLGTRPLFGEGMDKSLTRALIGSIAYKRSSLNTTLFPQGLYFMVPNGMVMAYVQTNGEVTAKWGNQSGQAVSISTGVTATLPSPSISMGTPYSSYNGNFLVFDEDGLPWLRTQMALTTVTSTGHIEYLQPGGGTVFNARPADATSDSISMYVDGGASNLNVFERKAIFFGGYYNLGDAHYNNLSEMILLDFNSNVISSLMGREAGVLIRDNPEPVLEGTNAYSAGTFFYECRNGLNACFTQYITEATVDQDRAYYTEKNMLRYIENPQSPTLSTVRDVYTHPDSTKRIKNFILNDDRSMIFYLMDEQLHCHNLSSSNTWCNNSSLYPYKVSMGSIYSCGNQMTWKDSQTLLISNCKGEVFQYTLP
jgi:hypothetical protein